MGRSFLVRLVAAAVLLFATYNPEGRSYFHWMAEGGFHVTPLKAFAGVCLLVGWVFLLRATIQSLGLFGTALAAAFFGTLIWLIVSWAHIEPTTTKGLMYLVLVGLAAVLATGSLWSRWRQRATGQVDVHEDRA